MLSEMSQAQSNKYTVMIHLLKVAREVKHTETNVKWRLLQLRRRGIGKLGINGSRSLVLQDEATLEVDSEI